MIFLVLESPVSNTLISAAFAWSFVVMGTNEASFLRGERSYYVNDEPIFQGFYHFAFREHERWLSINSTLPVYELQLYAFLSSE